MLIWIVRSLAGRLRYGIEGKRAALAVSEAVDTSDSGEMDTEERLRDEMLDLQSVDSGRIVDLFSPSTRAMKARQIMEDERQRIENVAAAELGPEALRPSASRSEISDEERAAKTLAAGLEDYNVRDWYDDEQREAELQRDQLRDEVQPGPMHRFAEAPSSFPATGIQVSRVWPESEDEPEVLVVTMPDGEEYRYVVLDAWKFAREEMLEWRNETARLTEQIGDLNAVIALMQEHSTAQGSAVASLDEALLHERMVSQGYEKLIEDKLVDLQGVIDEKIIVVLPGNDSLQQQQVARLVLQAIEQHLYPRATRVVTENPVFNQQNDQR